MTPFAIALECGQRDRAIESLREKLIWLPPSERTAARHEGMAAIHKQHPRLQRALECYALDNSGVPAENDPARFAPERLTMRWNFDKAIAVWKADAAKSWLYIAGPSGTGKSWSASRIMAETAEGMDFSVWQTAEAGYNRATEDAFEIDPKIIWLPGSVLKERLAEKEGKVEIIRRCTEAAVLVIDDLFHAVSGPFLESFRRILSERSEDDPTIITSNYRPSDILRLNKGKDYIRTLDAVCRRLAERCDFVDATDEPEVNF